MSDIRVKNKEKETFCIFIYHKKTQRERIFTLRNMFAVITNITIQL